MSYLRQLVMVERDCSLRSIDFDWRNPYSASKLSRAVRLKNKKLLEKLIRDGCMLDAPDNRGWTPLHEASTSDDRADIVKILISAGAYIEHKTVDGDTPLIIASKYKAEKIAKILIDAGATVNIRNNEYLTPLHIACYHRNENIIRLFISKGADLEAKDDEERTPLYLALEYVNVQALKILVEAGANLNTKDFFSRTPLQYACMVGNLEVFDTVIKILGHDKSVIDQQTPEGWTLLMEAAQYKNYTIAERLIEFGVDTTLVDNRNLLALHIAAHCERYNLLELILKHTPQSTIETYSTFGRVMTHYRSLPCLIIDKNEFDSLVLLFNSDLSEDVLKCPVQMGNHLVSPISFLILYAQGVDDNSRFQFLDFLLQYDYLLDPEFKLELCYAEDHDIKPISPIEAAIISHRKVRDKCFCAKILLKILERGVSPEKLPANMKGAVNKLYLFRKAVQYDFFEGIDLMLKYSETTEPDDILEMIVMGILNDIHINPFSGDKNMVMHLLKKCNQEVNNLSTYVNNKCASEEQLRSKPRVVAIKDILKNGVHVPSLKRLSRSATRQHVRELTDTSSRYTMREYIRNMQLPRYITQYLLYEIDF